MSGMKNILLVIGISMMAVLSGCAGSREDVMEEPVDTVVSEDKAESDISENEISDSEVSENNEDENDLSEDGTAENNEEEEEQLTVYRIEQDAIVNLEEALDGFWDNRYSYAGKITVEEGYVDDIPVPIELQDLFLHGSSRSEYEVEDKPVTEEMAEAIPEEAFQVCGDHDYRWYYYIDFDGDGENEYYHSQANGTGRARSIMCIHKNIDGVWDNAQLWWGSILYYDGRYYVDCGDSLNWAKDDFAGYGNGVLIGDSGGWGSLRYESEKIGFTPYEIYSNTQDDSIDYLENINWETMKDEDAVQVKIETDRRATNSDTYIWVIDEENIYYLRTEFEIWRGWERYYEGEQYLYVYVSQYGVYDLEDRGLIILHRTGDETWEVVKAYYLSRNYRRHLK